MKIDPKTWHDFINNSLRLEVLIRLVCDSLQKNELPEKQYMDDLDRFLSVEKNLLVEIKEEMLIN